MTVEVSSLVENNIISTARQEYVPGDCDYKMIILKERISRWVGSSSSLWSHWQYAQLPIAEQLSEGTVIMVSFSIFYLSDLKCVSQGKKTLAKQQTGLEEFFWTLAHSSCYTLNEESKRKRESLVMIMHIMSRWNVIIYILRLIRVIFDFY